MFKRCLQKGPIFLCLISLLYSCSFWERRKNEQVLRKIDNSPVPKAQYDELLKRYELALKELEHYREGKGDKVQDLSGVTHEQSPADIQITNEDIHPQRDVASTRVQELQTGGEMNAGAQVENDILTLKKALNMIEQKEFASANNLLQKLEHSSSKQVAVRAKFSLGESFFLQKEYDLAMQAFEDVIKNYAFSGLVVKALDRLAICSENLKMPEKKKQYESLQREFAGR